MLKPIRRVVTGHDAEGRSIVLSDGQTTTHDVGQGRSSLFDIWFVSQVPTLIEAVEPDPTDIPLDFVMPTNGLRIRYIDVPPGGERAPFVHRTESLDVAIVVEGEMTMTLDDQEVVLGKGDVLVQRGTNHAWINRGPEVCRMLFIIIGGKLSPDLMKSLGLDEIVWDPVHGGTGG